MAMNKRIVMPTFTAATPRSFKKPPHHDKAAHRGRVTMVRLNPRLPPVSVDDLALMLEIDLMLGLKKDFRARLQRALDAIFK